MNQPADLSTSLKREAEDRRAGGATSWFSTVLSPHARRTAFWAAAILTGANAIYLVGLAWFVSAGFTGPEPLMTRILASASVFPGAPAYVVLVAALASQHRPHAKRQARLSLALALVFATLAIANRIFQFMILGGLGDPSLLDLYVAGSPAQYVEFIAFGPVQGASLFLAATLFPAGNLSGWIRRLFALSGSLTFVGGSVYIFISLAGPSFPLPPQLGLLICLPAWVILYPAATVLTAWLLRQEAGTFKRPLVRSLSG